jgi:hypothetical protein
MKKNKELTPNQLCDMPWFPRSSPNTIIRWIKKGIIKGNMQEIAGITYYTIPEEEVNKLRAQYTGRK